MNYRKSISDRARRSILIAYRMSLNLYPAEFRERHAEEMLHCAACLIADSPSIARAMYLLAEDSVRSLLWEYLAMSLSRIPQLAILLTLTTFIAGTGYLISQQVLRMSANDPQIQLAEDASSRINSGEDAARVVPERQVDMASSLAPFVVIYDDLGRPIASSAHLNGAIPTPPRGVLDYVRAHQEERVTWQPRPGVRIATVVTKSANGFVIAGRNMREVEAREAQVFRLAALGWLFANIALTGVWLVTPLFGRSRIYPAGAVS
jgi:hypothetical protein